LTFDVGIAFGLHASTEIDAAGNGIFLVFVAGQDFCFADVPILLGLYVAPGRVPPSTIRTSAQQDHNPDASRHRTHSVALRKLCHI
jgi:hypothetical protein